MLRPERQDIWRHSWHGVAVTLVIGLLWTAIGLTLWHDHDAAKNGALKETANLVRSFDESITRTVEAVDQTLLFIREEYRQDRASFDPSAWAKSRSFLNDLHLQISIADRQGQQTWSNLDPVDRNVNIFDREHFQVQMASKDDALFISRPVIGRASNRWSIQFVRKLIAPDGTFDGVAVVSLDPNYLSRFYSSIAIGHGSIILANTDGVILIRAPESASWIGRQLPGVSRERLLQGSGSGGFRAVSGIDQVERIVSFRRLEEYPLLVTVALATGDVFAPFERNMRLYVAAGLLLTAAIIIAGMVMRRQARSILDSNHALAVTLENISQGITMIQADGSVPVMNRRAIDLLGLPPELMVVRPTLQAILKWQLANREFGDPSTRDAALTALLHDEKSGPSDDVLYEHTRPNGTVLEVRSQTLAEGGVVCTYTDITERRRNETALAAAQSRAAHAERLQALGQLAGGIAHDFNNVLQAVQGAASIIDKRAGDAAAAARFSRMILEAADRGASVTRRLLSFARRGNLQAETVDVGDLLHGLRDVLSHTLGSPISVTVDIAADLPPLRADKGQLETALINLSTNARDAMPDGGTLSFAASAEVVASSRPHPADLPPGRYVCLVVKDTGTGMDRDMLARVFEPFFTTKSVGQGTGLGLSMVKGFVEQSGGGMTIDSSPGKGTKIRLWLPAADQAAMARTNRASVSARGAREGRKRVLLVDDEVMIRDTLKASLEDAGYSVMVAASGAEALALLRTAEIVDVLVSDLSMPGVGGLTVIQEARLTRPGLPAIVLTGYAGVGAQQAIGGALDRSFTLLRKPVSAVQLADRIEALLVLA